MTITATKPPVPSILILLAHEIRWQLVHALGISDYRVRDLVQLTNQPLNLVSYHLRQLREHHLVRERRSSADAREVYYHLDVERLQRLYISSGEDLHPVLAATPSSQGTEAVHPPTRILFLCTHNSARSQMAEALMRKFGGARVEVFSAGSEPASVNPEALEILRAQGIDASGQYSKHMDQFYDTPLDYIITVCDRARETCPVFPNDPEHIHWSFPDPNAVTDDTERRKLFESIARELAQRINYLLVIINRKR